MYDIDEEEDLSQNPDVQSLADSASPPSSLMSLDPRIAQDLDNKLNGQAPNPTGIEGSDRLRAAIAALGAGIAGTDPAKAGRAVLEDAQKQKVFERENDPNSEESKLAQQMFAGFGYKGDPSKITAARAKAVSPMLTKQFEAQQKNMDREEKARDREDLLRMRLDEQRQKKQEMATEGQRAVDRDYAKSYNTFTQKGAVNAKTAIDRLEKLTNEIENDTGPLQAGGGRLASVLPDVLRSRDAIRRRDQARNFANTTLKELFGGQLSDAEREAAAKEYYNDALSNEENAQILRQKIGQLKDSYATEMGKAKYYEDNGTLRGFKGASSLDQTGFNNSGGGKKVSRKQYSPSANKTKITYDDGTEEILDGRK